MKYFGTFLLLLVGFLVWLFLFRMHNIDARFLFSEAKWPLWDWWIKMIGGYLLLLLGIVLGVMCRLLFQMKQQGESQIKIKLFFGSSFKSIDLWISLIGSPLLYASVLRSTGTELSLGSFSYIALQTGFSSYLIIRSLLENPQKQKGSL